MALKMPIYSAIAQGLRGFEPIHSSIIFYSPFNHLMKLLAQEYFIKFGHHESFEIYTTHLSITKYILKLGGICSFCNVNTCT